MTQLDMEVNLNSILLRPVVIYMFRFNPGQSGGAFIFSTCHIIKILYG